MTYIRAAFLFMLAIFLAGCSEPLPLLPTSLALDCMVHERYSGTVYDDGQSESVWGVSKSEYRDECKNHLVDVPAFFVDSSSDTMWFKIPDPTTETPMSRKLTIETDRIEGVGAAYGDKVRLSGVLKSRSYDTIELDDAAAVKIELSPEEVEKRASHVYVSPEEMIRRNREQAYRDQAEADRVLREHATDKRDELIAKAIRHETVYQGTTRLDSFELPGNRFVSCRLTQPGPVYTCNERSPK